MLSISVAVEGSPDQAAVLKIAQYLGLDVAHCWVKRGKGNLDKSLAGYNNAARFSPWMVLRDLDTDADCAPDLIRRLLPNPEPGLAFRVAVRQVESWFLGDAERLAQFLGVAWKQMPPAPEALSDAKASIVQLAARSQKKDIRLDMVPFAGSQAKEGPACASRMSEFARCAWRPEVAAERCDSLKRCLQRLKRLR